MNLTPQMQNLMARFDADSPAMAKAIRAALALAEKEGREEGKEEAEREARERDWRDREIAASGVLRDAIGDERDEDYIDACAVGLIDTRDGIMRERDPERWAEMRAGAG